MWAFENQNVRAIIANIGGNDSERLLPFLDPEVILRNPKILCGLHFGHSSPICILPFGARAVLDMDNLTFSISDSGVLA